MMLALLVLLTVSVLALPLLPALREWMRPSDIVPLRIDEADALDPPYLAHSFAAILAKAVQAGASHLRGCDIVRVVQEVQSVQGTAALAPLPLLPAEMRAGQSDRLWHIEGEAQLTERTHFYAEVSASGALRTAQHGVYRALWSGGTLTLASLGTVLRWAHGRDVHVGGGCHLAGRVTAQHALTLAPGCDFMLLHAPRIGFVEQEECPQEHSKEPPQVHTPAAALPCRPVAEWPPGTVWNSTVRRAFARSALQLEAQRSWRGDVVCLADMVLGPHCRADGSLKARRSLRLGAGCHVSGSVVAEGAIYLEAGCTVLGSVLSETAIFVASGCTIGAPGCLATLTAPQIQIAPGVTVHGTVWAEEKGHATVEGVLA
jgi:hypothetical protein